MAAVKVSLAAGLLCAAARALCQDPGVVADVPYVARAVGVEIDPAMVAASRANILREGLQHRRI